MINTHTERKTNSVAADATISNARAHTQTKTYTTDYTLLFHVSVFYFSI